MPLSTELQDLISRVSIVLITILPWRSARGAYTLEYLCHNLKLYAISWVDRKVSRRIESQISVLIRGLVSGNLESAVVDFDVVDARVREMRLAAEQGIGVRTVDASASATGATTIRQPALRTFSGLLSNDTMILEDRQPLAWIGFIAASGR